MGMPHVSGVPLPSNLWNQRPSAKLGNNLWGSIVYEQNLGFKGLMGSTNTGPPHCVGIGHDGVLANLSARSDVTLGCGKRLMLLISIRLEVAEKPLTAECSEKIRGGRGAAREYNQR